MPEARVKADLGMEVDGVLTVTLVLHEYCRGQIIEKMAHKLCGALRDLGVDAVVSATPSADATVNHFMIFHYVDVAPGTLNTMAITHVDDALKVDMVRRHLASGVRAAVCMSSMTVEQLIGYGIPRQQLTYALPAHDGALVHRRIRVGITSNNYSDGRKRDWMLTQLSKDMSLNDFEFEIFGSGWDDVVKCLTESGARVILHTPSEDYEADYCEMKLAVPNFDYYFYPGLDEGSMGTLDALKAGVKTIVTRQGFHLDIPNAITLGFWDYSELKAIFEQIHQELRGRVDVVQSLTWERYARRHLVIWRDILSRDEVSAEGDVFLPLGSPNTSRVCASADHQFPIQSYRDLFKDPFRRTMAFKFLAPRLFYLVTGARKLMGRALQSLRRLVT